MAEIINQILSIRQLIYHPVVNQRVLAKRELWSKLCSSLDAVGDVELAIDWYSNKIKSISTSRGENHLEQTGETYLIVTGVLQLLIVQQDAVQNIAASLGWPFELGKELTRIRDIRNSSIGHPTDRKHGSEFNFIQQMSLSPTGFQLMTSYRKKKPHKSTMVDIPKMIRTQRRLLSRKLSSVLIKLKEEDMAHRKKFKNSKLQTYLPNTIFYQIEKVSQSVDGQFPIRIAGDMVDSLIKTIREFVIALQERKVLADSGLQDTEIEELLHALRSLRNYFKVQQYRDFNQADARVYLAFARLRFEELRKIAGEVDRQFAGEVRTLRGGANKSFRLIIVPPSGLRKTS
jgi:hypothetical protein